MKTQNIKQRSTTRDGPTAAGNDAGDKWARRKKMIKAKRGLKSLSVALALPLIITLSNIYLFGASDSYTMSNSHRPKWVPPIWALHIACLGSALLLGLCGWIVWAEGGFHKNPNTFGLYMAQFGLTLLWDPLVFKMGANWAGLIVAVGLCWVLFRCYKVFRQVNRIAADLVLPSLGWAAFLAFISFKFLLP